MSSPSEENKLESTILKITLQDKKDLFIISAFAPGNVRGNYTADLENMFNELHLESLNNYFVLAGDLNAKHPSWGDMLANTRGNKLYQWFADNQIKFKASLLGPELPSFPSGNSFLDIVMHDVRISIINTHNNKIRILPYDSDHNSLFLEIEMEDLDTFIF